jgi:MFS family permease
MARFEAFGSISAAVRQPNFAWYLSGSTVSLIGSWSQRVAMGWLTWELTHSGIWLGIIAFADLFPAVVFTPIAGVIADRVDRRQMSLISQVLAMTQALALTVLSWTGLINIWLLLALALYLGIVMAFNTAARLSMVPNLLARSFVPSALALDSATYNMARFMGPAVAGAMIVRYGVAAAFALNCVTFAVFIFALSRARMIRDEGHKTAQVSILSQSLDGIRHVIRHPGLGPILLLLVSVAVGLRGFMELLPAFADVIFRRGAEGFAQMTASAGVGAFVSAVWLALRGRAQGMTTIVVGGMAVGCVAILPFALTQIFWLALVGAFLVGAATSVCSIGTQTLMQNVVDGAMRGRVMSLYGVVNRGSPALGALVLGAGSELFGLQEVTLAGGAMALLVLIWVLRRRRSMRAALETPPAA